MTFKAFRWLATQRGWTAESIAARLAMRDANGWGGPWESPYYEAPKAYLHRVLRRGHSVDDEYVIPYRGLIALYVEATTPCTIGDDFRRCACGCGAPIFGRHRYANRGCQQRAYRQRASNVPDQPEGYSLT